MSRSFKHTPRTGHTKAKSDKPYKVQEHQRHRSRVRDHLRTAIVTEQYEDLLLPHSKQYGNQYKAPKDGKHYVPPNHDQFLKTLRK